MAWIAPVAGAVIGAAGSYLSAKESNKGNRNAGKVDVTTTNRSDPRSEGYRDYGAATAQSLLQGNLAAPGYQSGPAAPAKPAAGYRVNARGQTVPVRNSGKGGGGGGGAAAPGFNGQSAQTAQAIADAQRVAAGMENSSVSNAAQDYTAGTLSGQSSNPYRDQAADLTNGLDNEALRRYQDMLFNSDTGLGGGGSGGGLTPTNFTGYYQSNGQGGTLAPAGGGADPSGSVSAIQAILAGKDVPGWDAMKQSITNSANEAYNEQVRQRRLEAAGSGMYGGTGQLADEAYAQGVYGRGLADAFAQQQYGMYGQALGLGTQYDMNVNDNATSRANAALSAGTSASINAASLAQQGQLARLSALGNAVGMGVQQDEARASGMGALAEGFSADQRSALGDANNINSIGQQGYLAAGNLSLGSDQARDAYISSQNQLRAAQISGGNQRAALNFDIYRYNREAPMSDLARYSDIINSMYGNYGAGSQTTQGWDLRNSSTPYVSPAGQAIAGGVAGYQLGSQIYNTYQGGGGGAPMGTYGGG